MANTRKRKSGSQKNSKKTTSREQQIVVKLFFSLALIAISLIAIFKAGPVGTVIAQFMNLLVGELYLVFLLLFIVAAIYYLFESRLPEAYKSSIPGVCVFVVTLIILMALLNSNKAGFDVFTEYFADWKNVFNETSKAGGGLIGTFIYGVISELVDRLGTVIIIVVLFIASLILTFGIDRIKERWHSFMEYLKEQKSKPKPVKAPKEKQKSQMSEFKRPAKATLINLGEEQVSVDDYLQEEKKEYIEPINIREPEEEIRNETVKEEPSVEPSVEQVLTEEVNNVDVTQIGDEDGVDENQPYQLPKLAFLDSRPSKGVNGKSAQERANEKGNHVVEILEQFNVPCTFDSATIGPSVTRFEIVPEPGVRVNRIASLQDDIKMALAAKDVRIEAPIPGKNAVGIEIPNEESSVVKMYDMLARIPAKLNDHPLVVALGQDIAGNPVYGELDKMPHLLVAGATGSGKSVCMNSIITSILMRCKPDECKLVLIDPKRVEFTAYHNLPHLIAPVINDAKEASKALKVVVDMMDGRYELFADAGVRNIAGYNEKVKNKEFPEDRKPLPYIVVIIDELADLMMVASKDVEGSIQRITQLARAAGIHLIVATQRPSVNVITGVIKANIPSRIAFAVSSAVDSRTILDHAGAERLLGHGDMLYIPMGESSPIRVQGCYVSDDEVARISEFVKKQAQPHYDEIFSGPRPADMDYDQGGVKPTVDPLYEECKAYVIETQKASTSLLQRRFGLGYNRAARMIDQLEENAIIGPNNGSKPREVYVKKVSADNADETAE